MRSFLIAWVVAFALVAVVASGVGWYVGNAPVSAGQNGAAEATAEAPFLEADAVNVVASRLPTGASGEKDRQQLQNQATVTYHSPRHWRVCIDDACWVAHGPGRYAEAANDAARQRETAVRPTP